MIRSKPPSDAYRDAWDRVFGDEQRAVEPVNTDAIETKVTTYLWHCKTCDALVSDPENHQYHAVIVTEVPE